MLAETPWEMENLPQYDAEVISQYTDLSDALAENMKDQLNSDPRRIIFK